MKQYLLFFFMSFVVFTSCLDCASSQDSAEVHDEQWDLLTRNVRSSAKARVRSQKAVPDYQSAESPRKLTEEQLKQKRRAQLKEDLATDQNNINTAIGGLGQAVDVVKRHEKSLAGNLEDLKKVNTNAEDQLGDAEEQFGKRQEQREEEQQQRCCLNFWCLCCIKWGCCCFDPFSCCYVEDWSD